MQARVTNLPNEDHVMRYVAWGKFPRDEDDNVLGFLGEAFELKPGLSFRQLVGIFRG